MKKLIIAVCMMFAISCLAQAKDVTKFLGIPVDGTKSEMIRKLKEKGFKSTSYDNEILEGEFNGIDVNVHVVTNNNKVYRIMVADKNGVDERAIQIRFNTLCTQFETNKNYLLPPERNYKIPDNEDISYEIIVNKKQYQAAYFQQGDSAEMMNRYMADLQKRYSLEQLAQPTDEVRNYMNDLALEYVNITANKPVWFIINEFHGKYYILMYYDNAYNTANGEDL